jgi:hypothetical protein
MNRSFPLLLSKSQSSSKFRSASILILIAELLLAQWAVASPELHGWLHGPASCENRETTSSDHDGTSDTEKSKDHLCVVTSLSSGFVNIMVGVTIKCSIEIGCLPGDSFVTNKSFSQGAHLARGPPVQTRLTVN